MITSAALNAKSAQTKEHYKLVYAARHGEGWHNVAEAKVRPTQENIMKKSNCFLTFFFPSVRHGTMGRTLVTFERLRGVDLGT